jgi:glycosyltransferase involved in cell wall biosynthesis
MFFSVVVPVYNRPEEIKELLQSLVNQTTGNFEVIIVEDGSTVKCENVVRQFTDKLKIQYFYKVNSGPGPSRNFGAAKATGGYIIFFDSDCIIPNNYFKVVINVFNEKHIDAFGGPDRSHPSFTPVQKAISYAMTSFFTTGGIRGGKKKLDKFFPRSFNMGFSREVYQKTNGFSEMRFGEDIDMSIRIIKEGFRTCLIEGAFVYHKRRTSFYKFFKQVFNSGIARIDLEKRHPGSMKLVHILPAAFLIGNIILLLLAIINCVFLLPLLIYILLIMADSLYQNKSLEVMVLSPVASYFQLIGYGSGFISAFWRSLLFKRNIRHSFNKNFYK